MSWHFRGRGRGERERGRGGGKRVPKPRGQCGRFDCKEPSLPKKRACETHLCQNRHCRVGGFVLPGGKTCGRCELVCQAPGCYYEVLHQEDKYCDQHTFFGITEGKFEPCREAGCTSEGVYEGGKCLKHSNRFCGVCLKPSAPGMKGCSKQHQCAEEGCKEIISPFNKHCHTHHKGGNTVADLLETLMKFKVGAGAGVR